ncbi:MAG: type IV secretion system DNA-binding domain-containing protein [Patescibacteria group bacterium]
MFLYFLLPIIFICVAVIFVIRRLREVVVFEPTHMQNIIVLEVRVPRDDSASELRTAPLAAEHMFASLHGLLVEDSSSQDHISFEIVSDVNGIRFYIAASSNIVEFVKSQIYAQYPTSQISEIDDYTANAHLSAGYELSDIALQKSQIFPIKTFRDFEVDPLSAITSALAQVKADEQIWFQLVIRPIADVWQPEGHDYVKATTTGVSASKKIDWKTSILGLIIREIATILANFIPTLIGRPLTGMPVVSSGGPSLPTLSAGQELELKAIENKLSKMGFEVNLRVFASASDSDKAKSNIRAVGASLRQFSTANLNGFTLVASANKKHSLTEYTSRTYDVEKGFVLSIEELASIFHLPTSSVETPNIDWVNAKNSEPPPNLPTSDCTYIGYTLFRDKKVKFGIKNGDDRLRHMYLIGKSGTGKSSMFKTMITQDIQNGFGVGVLDPHGELIEDVLSYIPDHRIKDVILIDPSDFERPVGINLLELEDPSQRNLMASALVSAIKVHFDYSWGPRLEYLLNYAILTLLEVPGTTMLGITRLLTDPNYQNYIVHQIKDPVVREFWEKEYKTLRGNQKFISEAIAPIQNKVNRFLASTTIRNILVQKNSTIDIWDAMNSGKILLMNLSKGKVGEDNANLLGALLVSRIQFMALQRAKISNPADRRPFYLYVDEFQNFATGSFESILSESRKYKLGLYLTHQYTSQLPPELLSAVFGNVGTIASFSVGASDGRELETEFTPHFTAADLISLDRFQIYIKLMVDGMTSVPFSGRILLPWKDDEAPARKYAQNRELAIEYSRRMYGRDYKDIEEIISRWVARPFDKGMAIANEIKSKKSSSSGGSVSLNLGDSNQ